MRYRLLFTRIFVSCTALLCCNSIAQAQWVMLSSSLIGQGPYSNQGAVASADGVAWAGMYNLYKSTDLGVTWNSVLSTGSVPINKISFYDDSTGVISTVGGGLYLTTNQGATWKNYFANDNIFAADFAGSSKIIVAGNASAHVFSFTTDGGTTWTDRAANIDPKDFYSPAPGSVVAFIENSASSYIAVTTDYGQTWTNQPGTMEPDAHSFAAMPCDGKIIFGINEEGGNYAQDNNLAEIYLSRDGGASFKSIAQYSLASLAGCALITPAVVYVPTRTNGILESTDTGTTWNNANAPAFAIDCRDLVTVNDTLLLLADQDGSIWSKVDTRSKGKSFSNLASGSELVLDTRSEVSASSCGPLDTTLAIGIVSCAPITGRLDSLWLSGSSAFQFINSSAVPRSFVIRDSIGIEYAPGKSLTDTAILHLRYDLGSGIKDTSITLVGTLNSLLMSPQHLHREAASAYVGQLDSLSLGVDISSSVNLDSLWPFIQDIQATFAFDSSIVSFSAYLPPLGWTTTALVNHGNTVDLSIHKVSGAATNPLDLGKALFNPHTLQLATSWVTLPRFTIKEDGHSLSLCVTDDEDTHWSVKTLGIQSGVAESLASTGDGIFVYPNPAESEFFIRNTNAQSARITVYDAIGRIVRVANVGSASTSTLNIESLAQESYVVVCQIGDRVVTKRIVKER